MKELRFHYKLSIGVLFLGLLIFSESLYGGTKSTSKIIYKNTYLKFVDEKPIPVEGTAAIGSKLEHPRAAFLAGFEGKVIAKIYVNESGSVDAVDFIKTAGAGFEYPIEQVLMNTQFKPAVFNGKPVKSVAVLTFRFEIDF